MTDQKDEKYPGEFNALRARIEKLEAALKKALATEHFEAGAGEATDAELNEAVSAVLESEKPKGFSDDQDAPLWLAWQCPDCDSWATLGANAGHHMRTEGHGEPKLASVYGGHLEVQLEELRRENEKLKTAMIEAARAWEREEHVGDIMQRLEDIATGSVLADRPARPSRRKTKLETERDEWKAKAFAEATKRAEDSLARLDMHLLAIADETLIDAFREAVYGPQWRTDPRVMLDGHHTLLGVRAVLALFWKIKGASEPAKQSCELHTDCAEADAQMGKHMIAIGAVSTTTGIRAVHKHGPTTSGGLDAASMALVESEQDARVTADVEAGREPLSVVRDFQPEKPPDFVEVEFVPDEPDGHHWEGRRSLVGERWQCGRCRAERRTSDESPSAPFQYRYGTGIETVWRPDVPSCTEPVRCNEGTPGCTGTHGEFSTTPCYDANGKRL